MPIYKIVAADVRMPRDGRFIEALGQYRPLDTPPVLDIDEERIMYWLKVGAQPTDTVKNILSNEGIMLKLHLDRKGKSEQEIAEEFEKWKALKDSKKASKLSKKQERKQRKQEEEKNAAAAAEAEAAKAKVEEAKAEAEAEKANAAVETAAPAEEASQEEAPAQEAQS